MSKLRIVVIGVVAAAVVSVGTSIYTFIDNRRIIRKVKRSLGEVEAKTEEQIADAMIQKAVQKAAANKTEAYLIDVENVVLSQSGSELRKAAKEAVANASKDIRDKAASEVAHQVEMLDIEDLKQRVCDQAEKSIVRKFDGALDSEVRKFKRQLDSTRSVYEKMSRIASEQDDDKFRFVILD